MPPLPRSARIRLTAIAAAVRRAAVARSAAHAAKPSPSPGSGSRTRGVLATVREVESKGLSL